MNDPTGLLRRAAWNGFIAGALVLYLIAVGIVLAFAERNTITGVVTLGHLMLVLPPLALGYVTAGKESGTVRRLGAGLLTGLVSGLMLAAFLFFVSAVDVRGILVRVSPALTTFVEFDRGTATGAAINIAIAAGVGLLGAGVRVAPARYRRPLVSAALGVVIVSMLEPFLYPRLTDFKLIAAARFLFDHKGLTVPAAVLVFVVFAVGRVGWPMLRTATRARIACTS